MRYLDPVLLTRGQVHFIFDQESSSSSRVVDVSMGTEISQSRPCASRQEFPPGKMSLTGIFRAQAEGAMRAGDGLSVCPVPAGR